MEPSIWPTDRVAAFVAQLSATHHRLHEELEGLREDVDAFLDGDGPRPRDLQSHCLAFCAALTTHHTDEDAGVFPVMAREITELRGVIAELEHDHLAIAGILRALQELIDGISGDPDASTALRVRGELDGLTAIMQSHFRHEEKRLGAALDELRPRSHRG